MFSLHTSDVVHINCDWLDCNFIRFFWCEQNKRKCILLIDVANRLVNENRHCKRSPRSASLGDTIGGDEIANGHVGTIRIGNLKVK
jgi:hypothetical protein